MNTINLVMIVIIFVVLVYYWKKDRIDNRSKIEKSIEYMLILSAVLSIAVLSILEQSILFYTSKFFDTHSMWYFFTGTQWSADAINGAKFGAVPLFLGTMVVALIAMLVAVPIWGIVGYLFE